MLTDRSPYTVCIISPNKNAYSETFIRDHIERLPANVRVLYGDLFGGLRTEEDRPLLSSSLSHRAIRYAMRRMFRLAPDCFEKAALKRFFKKSNVDIVLAEFGPTGVAVMDSCHDGGIPLVVHFHGYDAHENGILEQYGAAYRRVFEVANAVIAVSRSMEQRLLELGAPREKVIYNPYGVDTQLFSGADPASSPPRFLAVGRFVDKKAPQLTLFAFRKVVSEAPDARLIMIGDGDLWEACKQLAKALKIDHLVEFLGPRVHGEVATIMRMARAFVQHSVVTSYGDSEGTPVAVLEGAASGLPVVSTQHAGIKDVVLEGETGFLVEEGDVDKMAERMLLLAKDSGLAAQMGRNARERICSEFTMEKSIGNLWGIIKDIIQDH